MNSCALLAALMLALALFSALTAALPPYPFLRPGISVNHLILYTQPHCAGEPFGTDYQAMRCHKLPSLDSITQGESDSEGKGRMSLGVRGLADNCSLQVFRDEECETEVEGGGLRDGGQGCVGLEGLEGAGGFKVWCH
ncbi:hypothetical protein B0A50_07750 [Salinomyces thailandicus]|uniref:Uncharacterized protein n=1 Tax=Salinomyces thailandicus TaxID=706561 RepID=A0A4U0TLP3_9PEZI|nr:hypothetical protein B0A50_07750 [Salinomyces thailandica]